MHQDHLATTGDELTVVYTAANGLEANFLRALLESFSIPACVSGERFSEMVLPAGFGAAPCVLAPIRFAPAARRVLEEWEERRRQRTPEDDIDEPDAPALDCSLGEDDDDLEFRKLWEDDPGAGD